MYYIYGSVRATPTYRVYRLYDVVASQLCMDIIIITPEATAYKPLLATTLCVVYRRDMRLV